MKKTNKPNPLKVFNDNKAMAYKKAGGEMAAYKSNLRKLQDGGSGMGRMAADDAKFDAMINQSAPITSVEKTEGWSNINKPNRLKALQATTENKLIMPWASPSTLQGFYEEPRMKVINPYQKKKGGSVRSKRK